MKDESGPDKPLPKDWIVIRGGTMVPQDVMENARDHNSLTEGQEWAISVSVFPKKMTLGGACKKAKLWNSQICLSTVGDVEGLGYMVRFDGGPRNHANIMLLGEPSYADIDILKGVFWGPIRNPGQRVRRRKRVMVRLRGNR